MTTETKLAKRSPLLPDRHPIQDFFICDVTDAIPKDDMGSMEHPIFSLGTKPDLSIREYEHKGVKISILPGALGLATIHDKDTTGCGFFFFWRGKSSARGRVRRNAMLMR